MWIKNSKKNFIAMLLVSLLLLSMLPAASAYGGAIDQGILMSLSCNSISVVAGESCLLSATFDTVVPIANGSVAFSVNGSYLGTASVSDNSASVRWTPSSATTYNITAVYTSEDNSVQASAGCYIAVQTARQNPSTNNNQQNNTLPNQLDNSNQNNEPDNQNNDSKKQTNKSSQNNDNTQTDPNTGSGVDIDALVKTLGEQEGQNSNNDSQSNTQQVNSDDLPNENSDETTQIDENNTDGVNNTNSTEGQNNTSGRNTVANENEEDGKNTENGEDTEDTEDDEDDENAENSENGGNNENGQADENNGNDQGNENSQVDENGENAGNGQDNGSNGSGQDEDNEENDEDGEDGEDGEELEENNEETNPNTTFSAAELSNMMPLAALLADITPLAATANYTVKLTLIDDIANGKVSLVADITGVNPNGQKVTFYVNGIKYWESSVVNGKAAFDWAMTNDGYYTFTAEFKAADNSTYSSSLSVRRINGVINPIGYNMPVSGAYRLTLTLQNGQLGTNAILNAAITGANVTNGSVDFYVDGAKIQSNVAVNAVGRASYTWIPIPEGFHTFSATYKHANGEIATNYVSVYVRNGFVSNADDWNDWYSWNDWRYMSPRIPTIAMDVATKVSGTSATFTVTLSPAGNMGVYSPMWNTVPWYGNNYDQANWYGYNPYNLSGSYVNWVSPDGSSYGRTPTWNTSWGPMPTGYVSFFNGNTFLGSATLLNGVATFTWNKISAGTKTVRVTYMGDHNYETITENVKVTIKGSTTATSAPRATSRAVTAPSIATLPPTIDVVNARLRNGIGILQESYDLQSITMLDSNLTLATTKVLDQYRYTLSIPEMRRLAHIENGNVVLQTPLFTCFVPYTLSNNLTDLTGYLLRNNLSESQIELRVDIEPIVNVELNTAYKKANPDSKTDPTFYSIEIGIWDTFANKKLDYNPGKLDTPLMLLIPLANATAAQRYDEQKGAFSTVTLSISDNGPVLTVDQSGVYVLTN